MPYIINNYRIPKPGQYTNVVRGVAESLKAIGRAGFVNGPISPLPPVEHPRPARETHRQ